LACAGKFVEDNAAPVFAVETAPCHEASLEGDPLGVAKKRPISVPSLDEAVWANALRTTTSWSA
jgi:hypothetical protein